MIAVLIAEALATPVARFERVDLFAEDAPWWTDDLPRVAVTPRFTALRWAEQVRAVVALPRASLVLGVAAGRQSVAVRRPLTRRAPVYASAGLSSSLGLPTGATGAVEAWGGPVRVALGLGVDSGASWARPVWDGWRPVVGLGVGIGRTPLPW